MGARHGKRAQMEAIFERPKGTFIPEFIPFKRPLPISYNGFFVFSLMKYRYSFSRIPFRLSATAHIPFFLLN